MRAKKRGAEAEKEGEVELLKVLLSVKFLLSVVVTNVATFRSWPSAAGRRG